MGVRPCGFSLVQSITMHVHEYTQQTASINNHNSIKETRNSQKIKGIDLACSRLCKNTCMCMYVPLSISKEALASRFSAGKTNMVKGQIKKLASLGSHKENLN